jgi:hypothetical protein
MRMDDVRRSKGRERKGRDHRGNDVTFLAVASVISGNVMAPAARRTNKNTTHVAIWANVIMLGYRNSYVLNIFLFDIYHN